MLYGNVFTDGQLRDISVKVLSVPASGTLFTRENECGYISTPVLGSQVQKVTCSPIKTGRYVQIQKNALSSQIALCEVKVYGFKCKFLYAILILIHVLVPSTFWSQLF